MELAKIIAAVGQRKDSPEVEALVTQFGGKVPLAPKKEGYVSAKKHDVELAWHWEVLAPGFYPPKKEGRKEISYVTSIWFSPSDVELSGLPEALANISHHMTQPQWAAVPGVAVSRNSIGDTSYRLPVSDLATLLVSFDEDGKMERRWTINVRDNDRYAFVRSPARSHAFSPWNPSWPDDQADLPMGMFIAWCIDRGRIGARHLEEHAELVKAVRERKMTGREFLYARPIAARSGVGMSAKQQKHSPASISTVYATATAPPHFLEGKTAAVSTTISWRCLHPISKVAVSKPAIPGKTTSGLQCFSMPGFETSK